MGNSAGSVDPLISIMSISFDPRGPEHIGLQMFGDFEEWASTEEYVTRPFSSQSKAGLLPLCLVPEPLALQWS